MAPELLTTFAAVAVGLAAAFALGRIVEAASRRREAIARRLRA
jgi:F0F1-type ATP synthase membrane subunit c/vacuolar-type H+-ATPase subunit K